jgi:hypothetical protein
MMWLGPGFAGRHELSNCSLHSSGVIGLHSSGVIGPRVSAPSQGFRRARSLPRILPRRPAMVGHMPHARCADRQEDSAQRAGSEVAPLSELSVDRLHQSGVCPQLRLAVAPSALQALARTCRGGGQTRRESA